MQPMNPSPAKRILVLLISSLLTLAGCSKTSRPHVASSVAAESLKEAFATTATQSAAQPNGSGQGSIQQPSGFAHVTYRPNVHIMQEEEGRRAIIGVSTYQNALLFDSSNPTARALHAGDVLMIKNLIVRKVLAAEETPDGVIVLTEKGALTDLIKDGQIHVEMPVRYGPAQAAAPNPHPFWSFDLAQPAYAQSPAGVMASKAESQGTKDAYNNLFKGLLSDIIDDWDTSFQATPGEGQTNLNIVCKKEVSGFKAIITGQGSVSNFGFQTDMNFNNSTLQKMDTDFKNLNGNMTFQWLVATESGGVRANESRIKLPGAIQTPLAPLVGGIPLNLEVSAAILIHPAITGGREYTKGQFKITYDGSQHFKVTTGNLDAAGNVHGKGAHGENGLGDVLGSEPASQDDAMRLREGVGLRPIRGKPGAPELAGTGGVQQKGSGGAVARKPWGGTSSLEAQGFDDRELLGNLGDRLRRFVTVELGSGEAQGF